MEAEEGDGQEPRDYSEVVADLAAWQAEQKEFEPDAETRAADVAALAALMADEAFMALCRQTLGGGVMAELASQHDALLARDPGGEVEVVVVKYSATNLRPVDILRRVKDESLARSACWSLRTLMMYVTSTFAAKLCSEGKAHTMRAEFVQAQALLEQAISVAPKAAEPYNVLGRVLWEQGDVAKSLEMYERCSQLEPLATAPGHNRLMALNYLPDLHGDDVFRKHQTWAEWFESDLNVDLERRQLCAVQANKRLRLGYISPDFCDHPTAYFARCLLEHHDPERFDVLIYSSTPCDDEFTTLLRSMLPAENWSCILGQPAHDVADQIRKDQVDMLVDLAGHTAGNRLDVMALKPAPLQFTYIGYPNTTGLKTIDFSITDAIADPQASKQQFTEELVRLPGCFLCYSPPTRIPDVCWGGVHRGHVTFGSVSNLAKISAPCVSLWAEVLQSVPGSTLVVKTHGLESSRAREALAERFEAHGVPESRLKLVGPSGRFEALELYNEVDIALDTCPYSGTTTTCEALLMGVPVISLGGGPSRASRVAGSLLAAAGLADRCVAGTRAEFVQKAAALAGDRAALAALRTSLREEVLASGLCDGARFMREAFEPMLLECWGRRCGRDA